MLPLATDRSESSNLFRDTDTIVAVSSPPGRSRRGLIRLSGPDVMTMMGTLLVPPSTDVAGLSAWPLPRCVVACRLRWTTLSDRLAGTDPSGLLPALATMCLAPKSYTGQDMAEIQVPGHPTILDRLVRHMTDLGARPAEPGELTFRAFLNGKLDLTQAEGIAATIAAVSETQLQAAAYLRKGELGHWTLALADDLTHALALVEAGIDFVDQEDVVPISPAQLHQTLQSLTDRLDRLLSHSQAWRCIESLPPVVLVGPPNSGKSTLFNTLLGQHRAVISPLAHTTRDVLAEPLTLENPQGDRVEVMLIDIAGLAAPENALDRQAQTTAREVIKTAELILWTSEGSGDVDGPSQDRPLIRLRTKADRGRTSPPDDESQTGIQPFDLAVSARSGQGIQTLRTLIAQRIREKRTTLSGQTHFLQPRHTEALRQAHHHLNAARQLLVHQPESQSLPHAELIAAAMRQALDDLALLVGRMTPDEVLGRVFATFCVGK